MLLNLVAFVGAAVVPRAYQKVAPYVPTVKKLAGAQFKCAARPPAGMRPASERRASSRARRAPRRGIVSQLLALKNEFPIGAYLGGGLVGVGVFLQLSFFNQLTSLVGLILALKAAKAPMPTNAQAAQVIAATAKAASSAKAFAKRRMSFQSPRFPRSKKL